MPENLLTSFISLRPNRIDLACRMATEFRPLTSSRYNFETVNDQLILLGTSSFSAAGWEGSFYPKGLRSSDYLSYYAEHFHTVEVDSTFYACPSAQTVSNWASRTPESFIFSVKVPQVIAHEKVLMNCERNSSKQ